MAWLDKSSRVSEFSWNLHERRMAREGFRSGYVQPTPEWVLAKCLLCYPVRFSDFFYMNRLEYTKLLLASIKDTAERKGWKFVTNLAVIAREEGLVKDTPLIVAELAPERGYIEYILEAYPAKLLLRYADLARKHRDLLGGLGSRKKKAIARIITDVWTYDRLEFQAIKYRREMKQLLNLVHPKPPSEFRREVFAWIVGKGKPVTPRMEAAERILKREVKGEDAIRLAIEHSLPWEIVRSVVGLNVASDVLEEAARELMSGIDVAMQFRTLVERLGVDKAISILEAKKHSVPLSYATKAIHGLYWFDSYASERVDRILRERFEKAKEEIFDLVNIVGGRRKILALIDVSGSMMGAPITVVQRILIALRRAIDRTMIFSSEYLPPADYELKTLDDVMELSRKVGGGTPLEEAVDHAKKEAEKEDAMLLLFTDEMGNIFRRRNIVKIERVPTIVINPTPYPTEHIPKEAGKVVGLAGSDIDAVKAAARVVAMNVAQTEKVVELEKLVEQLHLRTKKKTVSSSP